MTRIGSRWWFPILLVAGAAALFLLPLVARPTGFPFAPGAEYSDALVAHLSSAAFVHRAVTTTGQIPLWNPTILSGMPFAADPLSGLWYPPLWLLALLPEAATINLLFWAHLVFGGWGMFLLLRSEDLGPLASLTGGVAFAGMPKLVGHVGLGHLTLVSAVCWTPWVLLLIGRGVEGVGRQFSTRRFLVAGAAAGVVFVADPRWFFPTALIATGYGAWRWRTSAHPAARSIRELAKGLAAAGVALIAVGMALAVPFAELLAHSTRTGITPAASDVYALPGARLLGLVVSTRGEWAEWLVSMGSVAIVLAVAGLAASARRAIFWGLLLTAALILALGQGTLLGQAIAGIPGVGLLRVPARWLFFSGMAVAGLAGLGMAALENGVDRVAARRVRLATFLAAAVIAALSVALGLAADPSLGASALFAILAAAGIWLATREAPPKWIPALLLGLLVIELCSIDVTLVEARPAEQALDPGRLVAERLAQSKSGRLFSPSYAIPQEAAAATGLELADGVHPLQLAAYVDFMGAAVGFTPTAYSVTLPPFPSGDPAVDWGPKLDAERMGLLGIDRIASSFPVEAPGLVPEGSIGGVLLYRNIAARPPAWIEPPAGDGRPLAAASSVVRTPNRVEWTASGPGLLVQGDPMYPGWRATLDGEEASIETYEGLLRSVRLPPGEHRVVFTFVPTSLLIGLALSLAALLAAIALWRRA